MEIEQFVADTSGKAAEDCRKMLVQQPTPTNESKQVANTNATGGWTLLRAVTVRASSQMTGLPVRGGSWMMCGNSSRRFDRQSNERLGSNF